MQQQDPSHFFRVRELVLEVVKHLQNDRATLLKVSLVNRAFSSFARLQIWRRVVLQSPDCAELHDILAVVQGSPAAFVEDLCIDGGNGESSDVFDNIHLPFILNRLTDTKTLKAFSVHNIVWPSNVLHPGIIAVRNLVRSPVLTTVTIYIHDDPMNGSNVPIYLIDDYTGLGTLTVGGSFMLLNNRIPRVQFPIAQPLHMALNVEQFVGRDIWPRINTSQLQSLLISLPHFENNGMFAAFRQYGHALQKLQLNYMENAETDTDSPNDPNSDPDNSDSDHSDSDHSDSDHPDSDHNSDSDSQPDGDSFHTEGFDLDFEPFINVRELEVAFPTWTIKPWPTVLHKLIKQMDRMMPSLERLLLYVLVDVPVNDPSTSDSNTGNEAEWVTGSGFNELDSALATLHSANLANVRIALCSNDGCHHVEGAETLWKKLPLTRARTVLVIESVGGGECPTYLTYTKTNLNASL
ncbi:hypothetical protein C0991_009979 [Blastosporella zonata]|nr:hypothetical protein C0991_009979 [Blastosporella zonata]